MAKAKNIQRRFIIIAIIVSIVLYFAGVLSGMYANKIIEKKVNSELDDLRNFTDASVLDIKNVQLQQLFIYEFPNGNSCDFLNLSIKHLYSQLSTYWNKLPNRLEEYEKNNALSSDYISLKREYIRFSLRFWLMATKNNNECSDRSFVPILYFYSKDCTDCILQGTQFDEFGQTMKIQNRTVIVFPVDANFDEDTVYLLRTYYNITELPASVVNGKLIQGRVLSAGELNALYTNN
jgi:hypothetical protein